MKYDKKNISLLLAPIPIKSLPEGTKFLCSLIYPIIKEDECSDKWKIVARHYVNGSSQVKGIYFDQSYSPVKYSDSFIIKIYIVPMHIFTTRILDDSNAFQKKSFPIYERVCVITPPCYLDWFERSYLDVPLN